VTAIQPELWVDEPREAVAFYKAAFGERTLCEDRSVLREVLAE
jgi:uncharacterized glyoxalase superfamily protein PhnB